MEIISLEEEVAVEIVHPLVETTNLVEEAVETIQEEGATEELMVEAIRLVVEEIIHQLEGAIKLVEEAMETIQVEEVMEIIHQMEEVIMEMINLVEGTVMEILLHKVEITSLV